MEETNGSVPSSPLCVVINGSLPLKSCLKQQQQQQQKQEQLESKQAQDALQEPLLGGADDADKDGDANDCLETKSDESENVNRRRVQWVDGHGKEIAQVIEFEASDKDDGCVGGGDCRCAIQ